MSNLEQLFHELIEATAERDIKYVKRAQAIVNKLDKFLKSKKAGEKLQYVDGEDLIRLSGMDIDRRLTRDMVLFHFVKPSGLSGLSAGSAGRMSIWGGSHKAHVVTILYFGNDENLQDYIEKLKYIDDPEYANMGGRPVATKASKKIILNQRQKSTIVHELIHIFDYFRQPSDYKAKSGFHFSQGNIEKYYNDPDEFNAFYQDGASSLLSDFQKELNKYKRTRSIDGLENLLRNRHSDFLAMLDSPFSKREYWSHNWLKNLSDKYRKKFKSRLYQLRNGLIKIVNNEMKKIQPGRKYREHGNPRMEFHDWPKKGSHRGSYWKRRS